MANNSNHIMNRYGKWITNKQKERLRKLYKGYRQSTAGDMRSQYLNAHKGMYGVRTTASAYGLGEGYVARKKAQMDSSLAEAGRQYAAQADAAFENNAVRPAANATIQAENERKQREYEEKLRKAREKAARQAKAQADYEKALEEYNRNKDKTDKENAKRLAEYKRAMAKYKKELKNAKQRGEKLDRLPQRQILHGGQPLPKGLSLSADLHQYEGPSSSTKPKKGKKNLPLPKKGKNGGRGGLLSTDMYEYESGTGHQPISAHQGLNNRPVAPKTNYAANQAAVQKRQKAKEAVVGKPTKPILAITDTPIPVAPHIEKDLVAKVEAVKPEEIPQLKADYINSAVEHENLVGDLYNALKPDMNRVSLAQEFNHWVGVAQNTALSPAERKQAAMYASRAAEEYNLQDNGKAHKDQIAMLTQMVNDSHDQLVQQQYLLQQKGVRMSEDEIGFDTGYLRQYGAIPAQANDTTYAQAQALGDKNSDLGKQLRELTKMEYLHSQGLPSGQLSPQMQAFIAENNLGWLIDQEVLDRAPLVGIETAIEEKLKRGGDERTEYLQRKGIDRVQRELSTGNPEAIKRVIGSGDSITHLKKLSQTDVSLATIQAMATGGGHQGKTGNEIIKELEKNLGLPSGYISFNTLTALKQDDASVAFINYCYATGQADLAKQYIFDLTEAANKAAGEKQADKISNCLPKGWKWIPEFMYHLGYGASNAIWGKIDFFRGKTPTRTGAYTQEGIIQNEIERGWSEGKARNWANALTSAGENFTDLAIGTLAGNALGAAGDAIGGTVGNIVGKVAGHAPGISMGWSAAGNAKQEMLKKGYSEKAATIYGIFSGVSEAVLQEQVGGLVGFGDRGAFTKALSGLVNQIPNAAGRTAINAVLDIASEIGQEEFGNILDSVYRSVALGEGNDVYADFKEQFNETAVTTAISTLLLNALHIPTQIRNERGYSAIADALGMSLNDAKFLLETDAAINGGERVDPNDILRYNELTANLMASMPDNVVKAINEGKMTVADWVTSNEGVVQGKLTGKLTKDERTATQTEAVDHTETLKGKTDEQRRDYLLNAAPTGKVGNAYYTTTNGKAIEFKNLNTTQKANYVLAQKCAKAFEGSVDVVIHDTLPLSNGAMVGSDGKLHIALDVTNEQGRESIAYWTLTHEAGHALKIADGKAWNEMFDVLTDYAKNHKDRDGKNLYDALVDSITNQYKYDNNSDAFNDEMFSLIAERMVGSEGEQWAATLGDNTIFDAIANDKNASAKAKKGFLGKLKSSVEKLSRQFRDGGFSKERKRLAKIREQLTEAYKRINEAPSIREAAITREVDRYAHEEARKIVEKQNTKKAEQEGREAFRRGIEAANKQAEEKARKIREDALLDELLDKFAEEDRVKAERDAEARAKAAELQGIAEQIIEEEQNLDEIIADLDAEDAKQAAKVEAEKQKNDAEVAAILQEIEIEEKVRADIRAKQEAKAEAERNKAEKVAKLKELAAQQKALRERTEAMLNAAVESAAGFSDEMARREAAATELLTAETAKNKPAETALSDKTVELLWTAPKDNNGWKKQYNYYYDALNDALRHVDSELFNIHLKNAEKPTTSVVGSKRVAGSATSWAIGAAAGDVRQGTISPMAAATLISRAYRQNGEEGLWDIVRIGDGNLTKEATEAAIAIDKEHNKPSATTNISPEAKKSLKTSPKKMNAGWHHYFPNGSAAFVAALNSISDGLFDKIKRKSLIYGRTVSQKGVLAAEGALQDLVRIIDNGYASPYKVATMLFDAMNGDADNAMEVLTDAKATAAIEREIYDDYYNAEVASKPAEEKPKPKKTAAVTEKQKQVIIKRLMKSAKKQSTDRMNLEGVMVREGKTYMLDGFRLFELNGDLSEGFPVLDEKTQTVTNGLIETLLNADTYDKEIPRVPSIDDVAAIAKPNKLVPVALGDNAPIVDAQKLLDMLQLLNPDTIRYTRQGKMISGIYAETEAGRGVTLPMRVSPDAGAEYSVQADGSIVKGDTTRFQNRATDAEYLSLAEKYRGGTASAEDINVLNKAVEEAARKAGYTIKAYHGTNNNFTVFDKAKRGEQTDFNASSLELAATAHIGFWFNNNDVSGKIGQKRSIASYLNLNNPLEYDSLQDLAAAIRESYANNWDVLDDDFYIDDRTVAASKAADAFVKKIRAEGYDGVIINDEELGGISYAVLDPSQIKSADPVTYDSNGDIIPLSERFNAGNEDIRYQQRDFRIDFNVPQLDTKALHEAVKGGEGTVENRFEVKYEKTDSGFAVHITDNDSGKTYDRAETVTEGNAKAEAERAAAAVIRNIKRGRPDSTSRSTAGIYIEKGEIPARDVNIPVSVKEGMRTSKLARTIAEASGMTEESVDELMDRVYDGFMSYKPDVNQESMDKALAKVEDDMAGAVTEWNEVVNKGKILSPDDVALGSALMVSASQSGNINEAMEIAAQLQDLATTGGKLVQSFRMIKRLGAAGAFYYINRQVAKINAELKKAAKGYKIEINQDLVNQLLAATDYHDIRDITEEIRKDLGHQLKPTLKDWLTAWRYTAMLGNLRTLDRNLLGNAGFIPIVMVKNVVNVGLQGAAKVLSGGKFQKTARLFASKQYTDFAKWDWNDQVKYDIKGNKYNDEANEIKQYMRYDTGAKGVLKIPAKVFNAWRSATTHAMEDKSVSVKFLGKDRKVYLLGDMAFKEAHYNYTLATRLQQQKVNTEMLKDVLVRSRNGEIFKADSEEARLLDIYNKASEYAQQEANRNTYNDINAFARFISQMSKRAKESNNKVVRAAHYAIEGILPFKNTPANIISRTVEYSPIGIARTIAFDIGRLAKGRISGEQFIENLAKGITGSGLFALGAILAKSGILRGALGYDDDEDKDLKRKGHQSYSIEIFDKSITLDWLAPECIPLFMGVEFFNQMGDMSKDVWNEKGLKALLNVTTGAFEPMLNMSMLQGVNALFEGFKSKDDLAGLSKAFATIGTSYLTQFEPTLFGQFARTLDPYRRSTYIDKNSKLPPFVSKFWQTAIKKIPGATDTLLPYVNEWGEKEKTPQWWVRALENFLSPAYINDLTETDVDREISRLFESTAETGAFPDSANKYVSYNGERYDLTQKEYEQYAVMRGETAYALAQEMIGTQWYNGLSDVEKVAAFADAYAYADTIASSAILDGRLGANAPDLETLAKNKNRSWVSKANVFAKTMGTPDALSQFIALRQTMAGMTGGRDARAEYLNGINELSSEAKALLMGMYDTSEGYADGTAFYNKNGKLVIDFANPGEAAPAEQTTTSAEDVAAPVTVPAPAAAPAAQPTAEATAQPKSDKYTKAAEKWAQYGVTQTQAKSAVEKWDTLKGSYEGSRAVSEYRTWLTKQNLTGRQRFAMFSQANADLEKKATEFNKKYGTKYEALWNAYTKYNGESFHGEEYRSWVEKQTSDYYQRFALVEFAEPRSNWIEHAEELHKAGVSYKAVWEAARYAKNQSGRGKKERIIAYAKKLGMTSKQAENVYKWFG